MELHVNDLCHENVLTETLATKQPRFYCCLLYLGNVLLSRWSYSVTISIVISPMRATYPTHFVLLDFATLLLLLFRSRDSSVVIATGYGLDDRWVGLRIPVRAKFLSSPPRPDRFSGPPSLLSNGHRVLFPGSKAAGP
jgi:hypothetical protein